MMQWYSAKCIFRHSETKARRQIYEERIILLRAESFEAAIIKAEKEAAQYCRNSDDCEYAGFVDVFKLDEEEKLADKSEIFSTMRTDDLSPGDYLERFYPDEPENCETGGQSHRWYNKDNAEDACYHCRALREKRN
jgi:hypothetical protein